MGRCPNCRKDVTLQAVLEKKSEYERLFGADTDTESLFTVDLENKEP